MAATVRIAGTQWLEFYGPISGLTDSTAYRIGDYSGDLTSSCTWAPPLRFAGSWLRRGALYEVVEAGLVTWRGYLADPDRSDDGTWTLNAFGYGQLGGSYSALDQLIPTAVTNAIASRGLPWVSALPSTSSLPTTATTPPPGSDTTLTLAGLLAADSQAAGKRWQVNTDRIVSYRDDPLTPKWVAFGTGQLPVADDDYCSHLYGRYVKTVTSGQPTAWDYVVANDDAAAAKFGRVEKVVDLTALGYLSKDDAQKNIDGRFKLVGARMGYTSGFTVGVTQVARVGSGFASPLLMRAGDMTLCPDVFEDMTRTTAGPALIILGEVTRNHDDQTAACTPIGFIDRDTAAAYNAAEAPAAA